MPTAANYPKVYRNQALALTPVQLGSGAADALAWRFVNNNATDVCYVKFFDKKTSPTLGTDLPISIIPVLAASGISEMELMALQTSTYVPRVHAESGLWIVCTKLISDTDNTAPSTAAYVELYFNP